jgi:hypothetical protein
MKIIKYKDESGFWSGHATGTSGIQSKRFSHYKEAFRLFGKYCADRQMMEVVFKFKYIIFLINKSTSGQLLGRYLSSYQPSFQIFMIGHEQHTKMEIKSRKLNAHIYTSV